jgi:carbon-monoxide dehydrogenase medium subunit
MKAAAFEHFRPASLTEAIALLAGNTGARALAGGQSLGPMLNLRLAQPRMLVQVNHIPELCGVMADADSVTIGACVTHAAIADGLAADIGGGVLAGVAENIAYRPIRNRGTIGGSLCHADPAADWATVLTALNAVALLQGPDGSRQLPVTDFIQGAFRTALFAGEILLAIRIPRLPGNAHWAYEKACRKPGDFAHAMAAVRVCGSERRAVIGALSSKPLLLEGADASMDGATRALASLDPVRRHMQLTMLRRALAKVEA